MKTKAYVRASGSIDGTGFNTLMDQGAFTGNVGGLVNWLLDNADDPKILIVDQATSGGRVIQIADGDLADLNTFLGGVTPELVITPTDVNAAAATDPFE